MMRRLRRFLVVSAAIGLLVSTAIPASAHSRVVWSQNYLVFGGAQLFLDLTEHARVGNDPVLRATCMLLHQDKDVELTMRACEVISSSGFRRGTGNLTNIGNHGSVSGLSLDWDPSCKYAYGVRALYTINGVKRSLRAADKYRPGCGGQQGRSPSGNAVWSKTFTVHDAQLTLGIVKKARVGKGPLLMAECVLVHPDNRVPLQLATCRLGSTSGNWIDTLQAPNNTGLGFGFAYRISKDFDPGCGFRYGVSAEYTIGNAHDTKTSRLTYNPC